MPTSHRSLTSKRSTLSPIALLPHLEDVSHIVTAMKTSEPADLSANVLALDALVNSLIQSIEPKIEEILRAQREQEKTVETFATHQRRLKARVEELLQYLIEEEEEYSLVGNFIFELSAGESWTLGPESVFKMKDITRSLLLREAYMIFYTEFRGPGRVWYSTQSFDFGFLGYWGTPTAWLRLAYDRAMGIGKALLGFGSE